MSLFHVQKANQINPLALLAKIIELKLRNVNLKFKVYKVCKIWRNKFIME